MNGQFMEPDMSLDNSNFPLMITVNMSLIFYKKNLSNK
jgi:hypothetical protein